MSKFPPFRLDNRWISGRRGKKEYLDPHTPYGYFNEFERLASGSVEEVSTILLSNKECPYRCLMCDLWQHTTDEPVPVGAIPAQIRYALERLPRTKHVKLYNSGSFFDRSAIPYADYPAIAREIASFETVIVESHTAFIGPDVFRFKDLIQATLQVALGLETIHPEVLPRLNKRMDLSDFKQAVEVLKSKGIDSRAFILLRPPFLSEEEGVEWAKKSLEFAFRCGVSSCVVIPVRAGNGALEELGRRGYFEESSLASLEQVLSFGIGLKSGLVFADLWDLKRFSSCQRCFEGRKERLHQMNLHQEILASLACSCCS